MRQISEHRSTPSQVRYITRRPWFRKPSRIGARLVALLLSLPAIQCFGSPSPTHREASEKKLARSPDLPFEIYNRNLIVVKGRIASLENVNIILDTGTTPTAISREIAEHLGLRGNTKELVTLNGTIPTQSVTLTDIRIGAFSADSIRVDVQDLRSLEPKLGFPIGAIVGLDILGTTPFMIDYRKRKVVFGAPTTRKAVRFESKVPLLTVKVRIEGQELRLVLDSGTPELIVFRNRIKFSPAQRLAGPDRFIATIAGLQPSQSFLASSVSLGNQNLGPQTVVIADSDGPRGTDWDGLLGFASVGFQKVSFDFENETLGWESSGHAQTGLDATRPGTRKR